MFNRIRLRLTIWYIAVLLVIVAAITGVTYTILYRSLSSEVDNSLQSSADQIASQLSEASLTRAETTIGFGGDIEGAGQAESGDDQGLRFFGATSGDTFYLVLDQNGHRLLDPLNINLGGVPDTAAVARAAGQGSAWTTVSSQGVDYRLYTRVVTDEGRTIAIIQVGRSLDAHQKQLRSLLLVLLVTGFGGLGLATVGGLFVAGRALRPVREALQRQRAFVADASHELRTPLTLLRGNAEILEMSAGPQLQQSDNQSLKEIVRQTEHIERLISDMSTLARMDEGQLLLELAPVDLEALLQDSAEDARRLSIGKGMHITLEAAGDLKVIGDETRLRELLLALVDNAVRYTPDGGSISLRGDAVNSNVEVSVSDTGPGIPQEHIERVFERFYRVDRSRSREYGGSGLGLSIGRAIAEAHGGSLTATSAGTGATFTLRLSREGPHNGAG